MSRLAFLLSALFVAVTANTDYNKKLDQVFDEVSGGSGSLDESSFFAACGKMGMNWSDKTMTHLFEANQVNQPLDHMDRHEFRQVFGSWRKQLAAKKKKQLSSKRKHFGLKGSKQPTKSPFWVVQAAAKSK